MKKPPNSVLQKISIKVSLVYLPMKKNETCNSFQVNFEDFSGLEVKSDISLAEEKKKDTYTSNKCINQMLA